MFTQIDWQRDIIDATTKPKKGDHKPMAYAMKSWMGIKDEFYVKFFLEDDPQVKANCLQLMEYFYAKWTYHHHLFYGQKLEFDDHPFEEFHKVELPQGHFDLETLQQLEKAWAVLYMEEDDKEEKKWQKKAKTTEKEIQKLGLDVSIAQEPWVESGDRDNFLLTHDNVLYSIYVMREKRGKTRKEAIRHQVERHKEHVERYHHINKQIFDYLKERKEHVTVMAGGGGQMQAFFSDENGYLAILYYNLRGEEIREDDEFSLTLQRDMGDLWDELEVDQVKLDRYWLEQDEIEID